MTEYRHIIDENLATYLKKLIELIRNRVSTSSNVPFDFRFDEKDDKLKMFEIKIIDGVLDDIPDFKVILKEKSYSFTDKTDIKNFSFHLQNKENKSDFVRFDLDFNEAKKGFPPIHANADGNVWSKEHLIYPEDIGINIERMNCLKAIYIFSHYINHTNEHPYDNEHNEWYKAQLNE